MKNNIHHIDSLEALGLLADDRRLAMLRTILAAPATLTHLSEQLGMYPAQVRHHLKKLESPGLVELSSTRVVRGFVEKYYQATARAFMIHLAVFPRHTGSETLYLTGSHDIGLEMLLREEEPRPGTAEIISIPLGSLDGLIALRQGIGQMAGCHLYDPPSGEYNLPYVQHLFPGQAMKLVTLAERQQGLIVAQGNPLNIRSLQDLARPDVRFVNRRRGSGTRIWLDRALEDAGIPVEEILGYALEVETHHQVAAAIVQGSADVGLGLVAAAQAHQLDIVPLFSERYDFVIPYEQLDNPALAPYLDKLQGAAFRRKLESLGGYQTEASGAER